MRDKKILYTILAAYFCLSVTGCGKLSKSGTSGQPYPTQTETVLVATPLVSSALQPTSTVLPTPTPSPAVVPTPTVQPTPVPTEKPKDAGSSDILKGKIICIDPGHQAKENNELELVAPAGSEKKEKMSWGTSGVATGVPEYKLNLDVSLKLKSALEKAGVKVFMTRESNDVNTGNIERAKAANDSKAELVIRIHADGLDNPNVRGASVLYPGAKYISDKNMISKSKLAAEKILAGFVSGTGAVSRGSVERNDLTGFNWSTVPVILIEMGFMTHPQEDRLLNSSEYQDKMVEGIVKGLRDYFKSI